jgi:hypothetical protein
MGVETSNAFSGGASGALPNPVLVKDLLNDINGQPAVPGKPDAIAPEKPVSAGVSSQPPKVPPTMGQSAPRQAEATPAVKPAASTSAKDLANTKPASSPITVRLSTQAAVTDAGQTLGGKVTFSKDLGPRTTAELSFGVRDRMSNVRGKPNQLQPSIEGKLTQTLVKTDSFDLKAAVSAGAMGTQVLDGRSPSSVELTVGGQMSGNYKITKEFSLQATGGVNGSIVLPASTSAIKPFVDGRFTYKPKDSIVSVYAGGQAEWTFPNAGKSSSASALYVGGRVATSKDSELDVKLMYGLDGNKSSYASSNFTPGDNQFGVVATWSIKLP